MKAREWLNRGVSTSDPVDRFSNLYRGFNNLFSVENGSSERSKIKSFLTGHIAEDQASQIMQNNRDNIGYLLARPVIDMRGNGQTTERDITAFQSTNSSLEKLKAVFMVIYQVRCNLEHGQKSPSRDRDIQLCFHSSNLLEQVLERSA